MSGGLCAVTGHIIIIMLLGLSAVNLDIMIMVMSVLYYVEMLIFTDRVTYCSLFRLVNKI